MKLTKSIFAAIKAITDSPGKKAELIKTKRVAIAIPKRGGKSLSQYQTLVDYCNLHDITKIEVVRDGDSEKLKAAADALRAIEDLAANSVDVFQFEQIHTTARNARLAAQE